MAHRFGTMSEAAPARVPEGSCAICGVWVCQHLLSGVSEGESSRQLGAWTLSERVGEPPPPPASFETRMHGQD
eukprot:828956-Alexandrium_andersonii.AAC.1